MSDFLPYALRILAHFWLEEVRLEDLAFIESLPELAEALPPLDSQPTSASASSRRSSRSRRGSGRGSLARPGRAAEPLTDLAAEYQRLFGYNLPPYESVFIDPSAMLMAPATGRVQMLYRQAGWVSPGEVRSGAPDHLGLELLALADWLPTRRSPLGIGPLRGEEGQSKPSPRPGGQPVPWPGLARQLQTRHLALWAPAFCLALKGLEPHPFYATLSSLTLDLLLATLPPDPIPPGSDPFPVLPAAPVYAERGLSSAFGPDPPAHPVHWPAPSWDRDGTRAGASQGGLGPGREAARPAEATEGLPVTLRDLVKRLLTPRQAGLFLTRHHIARISHALDLPEAMGERSYMLETLFRLAGQYDLVPVLFEQLTQLLTEAQAAYETLRDEYPAWTTYAQAWCQRLASTRLALDSLGAQARL